MPIQAPSWASGRLIASHAIDPGSIPGGGSLFCRLNTHTHFCTHYLMTNCSVDTVLFFPPSSLGLVASQGSFFFSIACPPFPYLCTGTSSRRCRIQRALLRPETRSGSEDMRVGVQGGPTSFWFPFSLFLWSQAVKPSKFF